MRASPRTLDGLTLRGPLVVVLVGPLPVLGLPGVVDLQPAVELLPAGGQQVDVCTHNTQLTYITIKDG